MIDASTPTVDRVYLLTGTLPDGWNNVGFADGGWALTIDGTNSYPQNPLGSQGAQWVCPAGYQVDLPGPGGQGFLLRHTFSLPSGLVTDARLQVAPDDNVVGAYINGTAIAGATGSGFSQSFAANVPSTVFRAGGDNVLALDVRNNLSSGPGACRVQFVLSVTVDEEGAPVSAGSGWQLAGGPSGDWHQLVHASGRVTLSTDGTTLFLKSQDRPMLAIPFGVLSRPSSVLLARDPLSGLPMWTGVELPATPPPPVSAQYGTQDATMTGTVDDPLTADPPGAPLPPPPDAERACGAAEGLAVLLVNIYNGAVQITNTAKSRILSNFSNGLKRKLTAQLVSLMTEAEFLQFEIDLAQIAFDLILQLAEVIIDLGTRLPTIAPSVPHVYAGDDRYYKIRCTAFQALWLRGGDYLARADSSSGLGTKDYWLTYLKPEWSFFAGSTIPGINEDNPPWQLRWLEQIIDAVPDSAWLRATAVGALIPSEYCASCPGYPEG